MCTAHHLTSSIEFTIYCISVHTVQRTEDSDSHSCVLPTAYLPAVAISVVRQQGEEVNTHTDNTLKYAEYTRWTRYELNKINAARVQRPRYTQYTHSTYIHRILLLEGFAARTIRSLTFVLCLICSLAQYSRVCGIIINKNLCLY